MPPSQRLLREDVRRRASSQTNIWNNIWSAAVTSSDSTESIYQKCRLLDGTVVVIGDDYGEGKGKSKKKSDKKSQKDGDCDDGTGKGKGKTCPPTFSPVAHPSVSPSSSYVPSVSPSSSYVPSTSPTSSSAPSTSAVPSAMPVASSLPVASPAPTDCVGKGKECMVSKKKKSKDSHKKLTEGSKKSKKSGKGKYEDMDLPECSDLTSSPTSSQNADTASPTVGRNANTPAPSPVENGGTSSPTTAADFERCNDIVSGEGDTTGNPDQTLRLFVLVQSADDLDEDFPERLLTAFRSILAIAAGCENVELVSVSRQRRLQSNPQVVEIEGFKLFDAGPNTCTDGFAIEVTSDVCTAFESLVNTYGGEFIRDIEAVCAENGDQLATELSVDEISCAVDFPPFEIMVPTASPVSLAPTQTFAPTFLPSPTMGPTSIPTLPSRSREGDTLETGGWIAIAGAALLLLSLCLCFCCNRRARKDREVVAYAKNFDDGNSSIVTDNHNEELVASRAAVFVDEDYKAPPEHAPVDDEEEIAVAPSIQPVRTGLYFDPVEQPSSDVPFDEIQPLHGPNQWCSSPTCNLCEERRQDGSLAVSAPSWYQVPDLPQRGYIQDDTVDL